MKSSRSVDRLLLVAALVLGGAGHSASAVTPQAIITNYLNSYILQADGSLWSLGSGKQVGSGFTALTRSSAYGYGYVLKSDGSVWSALDTKTGGLSAAAVDSGYRAISGSLGVKNDGTLWNLDQRTRIGSDAGYTAVWSFTSTSFASKADASLWAWGSDSYGNFGDGSTTTVIANASTTPKLVASGFTQLWSSGGSYFGLKGGGSLWAWGYNAYGQLGTGTPAACNPTNTAIKCVATATQIGSDFAQVSVGSDFALAVKSDGGLWDWGFNASGQLGTNSGHYSTTPQQVGDGYVSVTAGGQQSYGIKGDGTLWGWGSNMMGSLGVNDANSQYVGSPALIGSGYVAVWSDVYTLGLKSDGSVWAWGISVPGQSAMTTIAPVQLLKATTSASSAAGSSTDCVFNWLEKSYPSYVPSGPATQSAAPYSYRYYANKALLAYSSNDGHLYYQGPLTGNSVADLGALANYKAGAGCN